MSTRADPPLTCKIFVQLSLLRDKCASTRERGGTSLSLWDWKNNNNKIIKCKNFLNLLLLLFLAFGNTWFHILTFFFFFFFASWLPKKIWRFNLMINEFQHVTQKNFYNQAWVVSYILYYFFLGKVLNYF